MNDPAATDDEDMIESLQAEYMALAAKGDRSAFDFALEFSDEVNMEAQEGMMRLMMFSEKARSGPMDLDTVIRITAVAVAACELLLKAFREYAAPEWARTELARRREANQEMQQEWA